MFDNIGTTLQTLAKVVLAVGIIGTIIILINSLEDRNYTESVVNSLIGILSTVVSSFLLGGIGRLIENTDEILKELKHSSNNNPVATLISKSDETKSSPNNDLSHIWRCPKCKKMINQYPCEYCGNDK